YGHLRRRQYAAHHLGHGHRHAPQLKPAVLASASSSHTEHQMHAVNFRDYDALSPFEIKDELIRLPRASAKQGAHAFLNAGRGNANWLATTPREGFFLLGQFAIAECKHVMDQPGLGGMPAREGIAQRLPRWLDAQIDCPGAGFLKAIVPYAVATFGFEADAFIHELVDSVIGDNYPVPDRILSHAERVIGKYLDWAMCGDK